MKWTVGTKIGSGFGVVLVILAVVGATSYQSTVKLTEASDWVTHTYKVLDELNEMGQALVDGETGQRGYIITTDDTYLEPYRTAAQRAEKAMESVKTLTADNVRQQRRVGVLEPMIHDRVTAMQEGIDLNRAKGFEAAREWVLTGKGKAQMDHIRVVVAEMREEELTLLKDRTAEADAYTATTRMTIISGTIAAVTIAALAGFFITRDISRRVRDVTGAASKVANGDLTGEDLNSRSRDEIGELASAFTTMRSNLRDMASQTRQATENVTSTAAEILASTQQQAAATEEQAATVQEITGTLEEINQSGAQITDRAQQVSGAIAATSSASSQGLRATQENSQIMEQIRTQVEEVAENIVTLCDRTQSIGEIIATVGDIAEQSNLLALNASIEAASAGAQGGRFSVVAHEMKSLADRAKDCTVQVRNLLGEVQKGINSSVMLTEGAVKRVESGKQQSVATENAIREMSEMTERSIQAFQQILGGANQQQIGVSQVTQGMQDIRQAVTQTAAGTAQLEKAAANLNALSQQLRTATSKYRV